MVGTGIFVYFGEGAFLPFKGIQGHWLVPIEGADMTY